MNGCCGAVADGMLGIGLVVVAGNRKQVAHMQAVGGNGVAGWGKAVEVDWQHTEHCQGKVAEEDMQQLHCNLPLPRSSFQSQDCWD